MRPFCRNHMKEGFQQDCPQCVRMREAEGRALQTYRDNQLAANAKINKMEQDPPWPTYIMIILGIVAAVMGVVGSCTQIP